MTRGDQAVESAADKLDALVQEARRSGGVKARVGDALAQDPEFLRKLKPSLVKARAKGDAPPEPRAERPQPARPEPTERKSGSGPSPWLVVGAAFAAGYLIAKIVDWRGHAHPRR